MAMPALLAGCTTTGQSAQQSIWIETPDCQSASCQLRNDRGQWTLERTPGRVTVATSSAPLEVACRAGELSGHSSAPSTVPPVRGGAAAAGGLAGAGALGAATAGAAAFGGPFVLLTVMAVVAGATAGYGIGHSAEAATRAFAYPERITVPLRCDGPAGDRPRIGVVVRGLTDEEAGRAGLPDASAVRVVSVAEGSPAAAAGLRAGDLIRQANGVPLDGAARLQALLQALAPDSALILQVQRDGAAIEVRIPAPGAPEDKR
jgi:membrane-associated protease RseP (regulator of RpoE activity)